MLVRYFTYISNNYIEAKDIADNIRNTIKFELVLTISVGVLFNKIFAKLASDMKKPDATTVITEENFKTKVWKEPVENLLGVSRASKKMLNKYYIKTIGDLAKQTESRMKYLYGKNGLLLLKYAKGLDDSEVSKYNSETSIKSISHGLTTRKDLTTNEEVFKLMLELSQDIAFKLREQKKEQKVLQYT